MKKLSMIPTVLLIAAIAISAMPDIPETDNYVKMTTNMSQHITVSDVSEVTDNYGMLFDGEAEPVNYEMLYDLDGYPSFMLVEFEPQGTGPSEEYY